MDFLEPTAQGISGQAPIMIHGSTVKGLARIEPFVPEIRKGVEGLAGNIDMSALVYGLDPQQGLQEGFSFDRQAGLMQSYTKPKTALGAPDLFAQSSGSIYVGRPNPESSWMEAEKMKMAPGRDASIPGRPSLNVSRPPVRVSSEGFDVLHEISVDGKTQAELSKEIEEAVNSVKNSQDVSMRNANKVVAPAYQTTDDLIKDFTTKASSSQADEAGTILKDIFDKTDFANKQFDIPGSTRLVTGSDVLGKLSGIEMTDQIGGVAAYNPGSGRMQINPNLLGVLQPEEIATTFTHELFHTAADASGSLDAERLTRATSPGVMSLEDAKYLGQQEGIADSFSKRIDGRSWL